MDKWAENLVDYGFSKMRVTIVLQSNIFCKYRGRKCMTAPFMSGVSFWTGFSFYGLSIYGILQWVTLATFFWPLFPLHYYSQVATMFPFLLNCFVNFFFPHRITELNPVLIHDRTIPYLNTLPNYTLS